jgi:hypothetical protein
MREGEAFVNVGVWHGFTLFSGMVNNTQKRCCSCSVRSIGASEGKNHMDFKKFPKSILKISISSISSQSKKPEKQNGAFLDEAGFYSSLEAQGLGQRRKKA